MIIDLHYHTSVPGPLRPKALLEYDRLNALIYMAKQRGLDAISLTEHDRVWEKDAARILTEEHGILVLRGMEVSTNYAEFGHVLVYGLDQYVSGMWDIEKLARIVEIEGAIMFVAHPFRETHYWTESGLIPRLTIEEACRMPVLQRVDGIEVYNGGTRQKENEFALEVCHCLGMKGIGGSDAHSTLGVGNCATVFKNRVRDEEDLVRELRRGDYNAVTCSNGSFATPS